MIEAAPDIVRALWQSEMKEMARKHDGLVLEAVHNFEAVGIVSHVSAWDFFLCAEVAFNVGRLMSKLDGGT